MKENSKEWLEHEAALKARALVTLVKSEALRQETHKHYQQILKFMAKYPTSKVDKLGWLEKEKIAAEAEILFGQLKECEEKLKKLDGEYEELRQEINTFYGEEVMQRVLPENYFETNSMFDDDDTSSADWWKRG